MKNKFEFYFERAFIVKANSKELTILNYLKWIVREQASSHMFPYEGLRYLWKILNKEGFTFLDMNRFIEGKERLKEEITIGYVIFREEYKPQYIEYIDKLVELFTVLVEELEEIRKEEVVV